MLRGRPAHEVRRHPLQRESGGTRFTVSVVFLCAARDSNPERVSGEKVERPGDADTDWLRMATAGAGFRSFRRRKRRTNRRQMPADGGLRAAGAGREATREPMRSGGGPPSGRARRERTTLRWHTFYRFLPYMNKYAVNWRILFLKTENHSFSQFENYVKIPGERTNVLCTKTKRGNRKHFVRKKEAFSQLFSR